MIVQAIAAALLATCTACAWSSESCAPTHLHTEWSAQCFEGRGAARRVKPIHLEHLDTGSQGVATIVIGAPHELVAVDRDGKVRVPGIRHAGDVDYPTLPQGIGRFDAVTVGADGKQASRCGYFQADRFEIVVPAGFDQCQPFKGGHALACTGCTLYCTEPECQDSVLVGGQGSVFDREGKVQRSHALPTLETICKSPELVRIKKRDHGAAMLACVTKPQDPFGMP